MTDTRGDDVTLDTDMRIDAICMRFEQELQASGAVRIEDYLAGVGEGLHERLLRELIPIDAELRSSRGECPTRAEYVERFPAYAIAIEQSLAKTKPDPPVETTTDGQHVGPYRLIAELGRGGQGTVHLARDTRLQRNVALKILQNLGPDSKEAVLRFQREAELAARLEHPGICRVHDAGIEDGVAYIAMQYVEGETLAQRIAKFRAADPPDTSDTPGTSSTVTAKEVTETLEIIESVGRALHAAHLAGIVHRDIKPGNIMIDTDGQPVILDFGLSRGDDSSIETLTQTGDVFGTPAYMSPEQLRADKNAIDARTDVYSLGVVLFECLTLGRPFQSAGREALYQAILTDEPPSVRNASKAISRDLEIIVATALDKEPDRRYQTALDLSEDLQRARQHLPIHARPITRSMRLRRWAQRNPAVAASLTLAIVTLVTGLILTSTWLHNERQLRQQLGDAVREYDEMADVALANDLLDRVDRLWPCGAVMVERLETWVREAKEVISSREQVHARLAHLRRNARPYNDADRLADQKEVENREPKLAARLDRWQKGLEIMQTKREREKSAQNRKFYEAKGAEFQALIDDLLQRFDPDERLTWRTEGSREERFKHEMFSELSRSLIRVQRLLPHIEDRLEISRTLDTRIRVDDAAAWETCMREVRKNAAFRALSLEPVPGLVPLGRDRTTGLWEFWHIASGPSPSWDGSLDNGHVEPSENSGLVLVLLPGGEFMMGAQPTDPEGPNYDAKCRPGEGPPHRVELPPFLISKYEMTQAQWLRLFRDNPSVFVAGTSRREKVTRRNPVTNVNFHDAAEAMRRLDLQLPTEQQWEYAARAGTRSVWSFGSDVATTDQFANVLDTASAWVFPGMRSPKTAGDDGFAIHAVVGSLRPNPWGLYDMHGNVWEFCREPANPGGPPQPGANRARGTGRSLIISRGGSFQFDASYARSAYRRSFSPTNAPTDHGLRPTLTLQVR